MLATIGIVIAIIAVCITAVSASSGKVFENLSISLALSNTFTRLQDEIERLTDFQDDFWDAEIKRRKDKKRRKEISIVCESRSKSKDSDLFTENLLVLDNKKKNFIIPSLGSCGGIFRNEETEEEKGVTLHFCFLVHGYRGMSSDLSYVESSISNLFKKDASLIKGNDKVIIHSVLCNEKKTDDGVENGGSRVVEEIMDVIQDNVNKYCDASNLTISFIGNSLGGLYSRFAVSKIHDILSPDDDHKDKNMRLANGIPVHFNVFYSTAAPHLGTAYNTYVPLPRTAQIGIGYMMGATGQDLFHINDLIWKMATDEKYLKPLASFRKRVAYANAFRTDFPVPTETAAFLHSASRHPHEMVEEHSNEFSGLVVGCFTTDKKENALKQDETRKNLRDDLEYMSVSLDSLGWKKIFVDLRGEIPVGVNLSVWKDKSSGYLQTLKEKEVVESRDLASTFASVDDKKFNVPLGHNMICAHSRNRFRTLVNRGGRPVIDKLAKDMVEDILSWDVDIQM